MPFSVQCYLPRRAFEAIDVAEIRARAHEMGVSPARFEQSTFKIPSNRPAGSTRVTCSREMAVVFVECFSRLATAASERRDGEIVIQCANAVAALFKAIDEASSS